VQLLRRPTVQNGVAIPATTYGATSGDDGKWAIDNIDPGRLYTLSAQRTGFADARYGAKSANGPTASITLEAGQSLTGLTLTLTPQSVVTGLVTDPAGDPVQGAAVLLSRRIYQRGTWQLIAGLNATTNDLGEFRVANVLPGRYTLVASVRPNVDPTLPAAKKTPVVTFYPNATNMQGAAFLDVSAGQDVAGLRIRIQEAEVFTVRGKLVGNGGATGQILLLAAPKTETNTNQVIQQPALTMLQRMQVSPKPDGSFELRNLMPGTYTVQIAAPGAPARLLGNFEVTVTDEDISNLAIPVREPITLAGSIRLEEGDLQKLQPAYDAASAQNAATATVQTLFNETGVAGARIAVSLADTVPGPVMLRSAAPLKDDGTFLFENLAPGRYQWTLASLPTGTFVQTARVGGVDVTRGPVDLSASSRIDIVLSNKAAAVTGVVVDEKGESPAGIALCLFPEEADLAMPNSGIRVLIADQNGRFQFQNLRPGLWHAVAFEDIEWGIARELPYLKLLIPDATHVELKESARETMRVKIIPLARLKAAEAKLP
jgi:hypothetical protein